MSEIYSSSAQNHIRIANQEVMVDLFKMITFHIACDVEKILSQQTTSQEKTISYDDFCRHVHARIDMIIQKGNKENQQTLQRIKNAFQQNKGEEEKVLRVFHTLCNACMKEIANGNKTAMETYMMPHKTPHVLH